MRISLFLWFALHAVSGFSQCNFLLHGHVLDAHNGEPLDLVYVVVLEENRTVITDASGHFVLDSLCPGEYTLYLSHLGCEPVEQLVRVPHSKHLDITMEHHLEELQEVQVNALSESVQPAVASLGQQQLQRVTSGSMDAALRNINGVQFIQTSGNLAKPIIRGLTGTRLLVLNQGIRLEGQNWGFEHAPELDLSQASRIEVHKGASALAYGPGAVAGVVVVNGPESPMQAGFAGSLSLAGAQNGWGFSPSGLLSYRLPNQPLSAYVAGTYSNSGDLQAAQYNLMNTGQMTHHVESGLRWETSRFAAKVFASSYQSELGLLRAAHIGNLTDLQRAIEADVPLYTRAFSREILAPAQEVKHQVVAGEVNWFVTDAHKVGIRLGRQYNRRSERDVQSALARTGTSYEVTTYTADLFYSLFLRSTSRIEVAVNGTSQANTYTGSFFIPNFRNRALGMYAGYFLRKNKWELEAALRADGRRLQAYFYAEPDVLDSMNQEFGTSALTTFRWWLHPNEWFAVQLGSTWRAPHAYELHAAGLHHGASALEYGNAGLRPEQSWQLELEWNKKARASFSVNAYVKWVNQFIYLSPQVPPALTIRGAYPVFRFNQTDVVLLGVEANWQQPITKQWQLDLRTDLQYHLASGTLRHLPLMPPNVVEAMFTRTFRSFKTWKDSQLGMGITGVMRQFLNPDNQDYAPAPPGYVLGSLRASTRRALGKGELGLSLEIVNLFNAAYRSYLDRFRYFADQPGVNARIKLTYTLK